MTDFSLVDSEYPALQARVLGGAEVARFADPLYRRTSDAISSLSDGRSGTPDAAVLIRQVARRRSIRSGVAQTIRVPDRSPWYDQPEQWVQHSMAVIGRVAGEFILVPQDWMPDWLPPQGRRRPDDAALAGAIEGIRNPEQSVTADPVFNELFGFSSYRSPGQRTAVRAALTLPAGGTLICLLPTGSGKTEIALAFALLGDPLATTLVVVPTVSLAFDLERRLRESSHFASHRGDFSWTSSTDSVARGRIREAIADGSQRVLVTSPESIVGGLFEVVAEAARVGRIAGLVVDECHLVRQWGLDFRPEFRDLAALQDTLARLSTSSGYGPPRTILLSATLSDADVVDLHSLFGSSAGTVFVAANSLRPEPVYWIAPYSSEDERDRRVLEAVDHLARPLVLYATRPSQALTWERLIRERGYRRVGVVTGDSAGDDRKEILAGLRGDTGVSRYDVAVATSAFGLGIDFGEIRSVMHACLPETIDRWYQEIGRGGRDGSIAVALLVPAHADLTLANSLSAAVVQKSDTARGRWMALYRHGVPIGDRTFVNLDTPRSITVQPGSYNRLYSRQVLQGLAEIGAIDYELLTGDAIRSAGLDDPLDGFRDRFWVSVTILDSRVLEPSFWDSEWTAFRGRKMRESEDRLRRMKEILGERTPICDALAHAFRPGPLVREEFGLAADSMEPSRSCGQCGACVGVSPHPPRAVEPLCRWRTGLRVSERLSSVLRIHATGPAVTLAVVSGHGRRSYQEVAVALVGRLVSHGVRFVAAPDPVLRALDRELRNHKVFVDRETPDPNLLPDTPAVVVVPESVEEIDPSWFVGTLRERVPASDGVIPVVLIASGRLRIRGESRTIDSTRPTIDAEQFASRLDIS